MFERFTSATADQLFHIYLNDHRTGAIAAHRLAIRSNHANRGTEFGDFLEGFIADLEEDIGQLDSLFEWCSVSTNRPKLMAARLGDVLGRLKLNGRLTEYSPLSRLIEFETLSVGVFGKRQLWLTIAALPADHPAADVVDVSRLIERADSQVQALDEFTARAAAIAFTGA